ncbi:hypothetical protein ACJJTC_001471 [Scirpophaga incertulas]
MASGLIQFAFVLASGIINIMPNEVGAVEERPWHVDVWAARVAAGGVAALECRSNSPLVRPTQWFRGDRALHLPPPDPGGSQVFCGTSGPAIWPEATTCFPAHLAPTLAGKPADGDTYPNQHHDLTQTIDVNS